MKIVVIGFRSRGVKVSEVDAIQFFGAGESSSDPLPNCRKDYLALLLVSSRVDRRKKVTQREHWVTLVPDDL